MDRPIERILLVSFYLPSRGHGGGLRLLDLYGFIRRRFPQLRIDLAACRHSVDEAAESGLLDLFDSIHLLDPDAFNPEGFRSAGLLEEPYDVVDLQYLQSGSLMRAFARCGTGRIIFSPMESMVRAAASATHRLGTSFSFGSLKRFLRDMGYAVREIAYSLRADRVLCVSELDASALRFFRRGGVVAVETGVSPLEFSRSLGSTPSNRRLDDTRRVIFVAFFGSATNRDALEWYLKAVHPAVAAAVPGYRFEIVGRGLDTTIVAADGNVRIVGEVDSIETQLEGAWVGIAPALSGAGMRGKINQYSMVGVPCVASALAAEGFAYVNGVSIFVAQDSKEFAHHCITLLRSAPMNRAAGESARRVCRERYTWESKAEQIFDVYGFGRSHVEKTLIQGKQE